MKSIRTRLMKNFILISILPVLLISTFSYYVNVTIVKDKLSSSSLNNIKGMLQSLDANVEMIENKIYSIAGSERI
jgi:peptidoglycan hydrolase CwlO-like protein